MNGNEKTIEDEILPGTAIEEMVMIEVDTDVIRTGMISVRTEKTVTLTEDKKDTLALTTIAIDQEEIAMMIEETVAMTEMLVTMIEGIVTMTEILIMMTEETVAMTERLVTMIEGIATMTEETDMTIEEIAMIEKIVTIIEEIVMMTEGTEEMSPGGERTIDTD